MQKGKLKLRLTALGLATIIGGTGLSLVKNHQKVDHLEEVCWLTPILGSEHQTKSIMHDLAEQEFYVYENIENKIQIISKDQSIEGWIKLGRYLPKETDCVMLYASSVNYSLEPTVSLKRIASVYPTSRRLGGNLNILNQYTYETWKEYLQKTTYNVSEKICMIKLPEEERCYKYNIFYNDLYYITEAEQ